MGGKAKELHMLADLVRRQHPENFINKRTPALVIPWVQSFFDEIFDDVNDVDANTNDICIIVIIAIIIVVYGLKGE